MGGGVQFLDPSYLNGYWCGVKIDRLVTRSGITYKNP